ncbi:collagen alpha-3(VI) chain isoform X2 [Octopus bimaculoides]|uniref:collagen alpha-3(VI) chain isoform X2 n=1 Tax=Octopus bimaculoides TaxID=37653 RepID=UPI0022E8B873|nr:collagen alpha-3(VI) chain isoform X2 [Octopus bimaculoides]
MGRWLEISCFLLFLFYFSSQDSVYGNKIDMDSRKLDLVFLIHTSTQISDRSFELVKTFLKNLLRDSDIDSGDVRVGIAFYDSNPNILFNLPQYKTKVDLIGAIDAIPSSYRSDEANLARGLKVAKQIMLSSSNDQRPDVPNAVVVITDGTSSFDSNEIHSAAVDLKSIAYIFGVGIGIGTFGEMARIVTEPANVNYFGIVAIERLHEVEPQLTEQIMALQGDAAPLDVPTDAKADIVFLVHMSKKSTKADQNLLKIFMRKLLSSADIDSGAVRVAIVTYNVNSKVVSNFDTYTSKADVFNTIDNMNKFKGPKANAAAGLKMVLNKISINKSGDRPNVKNTLIMVTDQKSNKVQNSKRNADKLRGKGTEIFTVGVGFDTSAELNEIANHPAGVHAQFVEDFSKLNEANDLLLQSIPSFNVMKKPVPRSTNRPAPVDNTIYQTSDELDLVFAIHISENVNDVEMRQLMNFLINMFGRANIAAGKVRVGVITYGETESVIFDLNEYNDATAMVQAISSTLTGSKSNKVNVANLLESVRTKMFQDAKGDRKGVPDALIILTDKISNMEVGEIPFQAAETQKKGIRVFTVGINLSDKAELETVASRPTDQNVFTVTSYSELPRTEQEIVNQLYVCEYK